jgi:hypothetical protein
MQIRFEMGFEPAIIAAEANSRGGDAEPDAASNRVAPQNWL